MGTFVRTLAIFYHIHCSKDQIYLCGCSFRCGREPHLPILCEYLRSWLKKCDDDSETSNWIHVNTKVRTSAIVL